MTRRDLFEIAWRCCASLGMGSIASVLPVCAAQDQGSDSNKSATAVESLSGDPDAPQETLRFDPTFVDKLIARTRGRGPKKDSGTVVLRMLREAEGYLGVSRSTNPGQVRQFLSLFGLDFQYPDGGFVPFWRLEVRRWFDDAQKEVPELAKGIGGIQKPIVSSPYGVTFPIGLLDATEIREIPLGRLRPQLLRVRCENENYEDPLHLEKELRAEFRDRSRPATRGRDSQEPAFVYLDEAIDDLPDAYSPQVIYKADGTFQLRLKRGDTIIAERKFVWTEHDPASLRVLIATELVPMLPKDLQ